MLYGAIALGVLAGVVLAQGLRGVITGTPAGRGRGALQTVAAILLASLAVVLYLSVPPRSAHDEGTAWQMCREFVTDRLKAPRSARFPPSYQGLVRHQGGGVYIVSAYVDAQNDFGAMVRTSFTCRVQHTGGKKWALLDLSL